MYLNILKRDLKRKKTMNVILLIFVIIATMFVGSSVNNIMAAVNGTDYFFKQANIGDYIILQKGDQSTKDQLEKVLDIDEIDSFSFEEMFFVQADQAYVEGKPLKDFSNVMMLMPVSESKLNYFDKDDNKLTSVEKGKAYVADSFLKKVFHAKVGDTIEFRLNGGTLKLEIAGTSKDVVFSSMLMGNPRFIISDEDFEQLRQNEAPELFGRTCHVYSDDTKAIEKATSDAPGVLFVGPQSTIRLTYIFDVIIAVILLVVSICLILVSVIVLRFTISFTIEEEFREIGVMKAIGIKSSKIRGLYLTKYIALAIIGSIIGFFASIPFGNVMLKSVAQKMVLGNDLGILVNVFSSIAVVLVVFLFSWLCTSGIKKLTPLDAIRSGQSGERFNKKRGLRIGKTPLSAANFTAINDVLSAPKRYITLIIAFTLSLSIVLVLVITSATLKSDTLLPAINTEKRDIYIGAEAEIGSGLDLFEYYKADGFDKLNKRIDDVERELIVQGIPASVSIEVMVTVSIKADGEIYSTRASYNMGHNPTDTLTYLDGSAPQNYAEIAVSTGLSDKADVHIGDTISINYDGTDRECLVTGLFETMSNNGQLVRLYKDARADFSMLSGYGYYEVNYTDSPSKSVVKERYDKLVDLYGKKNINTGADVVETATGVGSMISSVKYLVLVVSMLIVALVTLLMERTFITKEKSEIALMKAIGFKSSTICRIHVIRFAIVAVVSSLISMAVCVPLTKLTITPVFAMIGSKAIDYAVNPLEVCVIYPLAVILITVLTAFLTSLYTKTIKAHDTSNIE